MKRLLTMFALLLAFALVAAACSSDDSSDTTAAGGDAATTTATGGDDAATTTTAAGGDDATTTAAGGDAASGDVVEVEFWHAMAEDLGAVVDELVNQYNSSQDAVHVNATFQGSYDDTFNAFTAGLQAGTAPNIVQNFDLASQTMIDTGSLLPAYTLMAEGEADKFIPAARDYYSDENGMVGLAFNSSTPIVYYNADKFTEAGVAEPAKDWTFTDFMAACEALEAAGTEFCVTFGTVGWYFEQILANSGGLYFDNDNGRTGRATEARFNEATGVEVFGFLTGLIADEHAPNLGNTWSDTDSVFLAGDAAMIFDSTSDAFGFQENADFEVKTAYIPHTDSSERNGVVIGGAALWLIDSEDDAADAASWDFMNFMTQEAPQVVWHTQTGYFPVLEDLEANPPAELVTFWEENPNFRTAIDQLVDTNTEIDGAPNYPVLGGRSGPSPEIRRLIVEAYSAVLDGGATPQEALDSVAEQTAQILADYNEFVE
jgi:sn-glycerol 3-phosphate transport system substrate-binding protein